MKYLYWIQTDDQNRYRLDHLTGYLDNLRRTLRKKDGVHLWERRGFKTDKLVNAIEFSESSEYFGHAVDVWESTKENLWQIFHVEPSPHIIVLTGAAGAGKSVTSWITMGRIAYMLGNMWNPQIEFGLSPGSRMFIVLQSVRQDTVGDSLFDPLKDAIDGSSWFQKHMQRNKKVNDTIIFPDQNLRILKLTGTVTSAIGKNVFSGVVTEINFMSVSKNSVHLQHSDKGVWDVGEEMFRTLDNRISDRFQQVSGDFPGKLIADSARNHESDFAGRMIERAKTDPHVLVISRPVWDAKRHEYPKSEGHFSVELGDDTRPPRILQDESQSIDPESIIKIPNRHRNLCETDIEEFLRSHAGIPSSKTGRFVPFPEQITRAQQRHVELMGGLRLFKVDEICFVSTFEIDILGSVKNTKTIDWDLLINFEYIERLLAAKHDPFAMHCDLSLSGDAAGLGLGRVVDWKFMESTFAVNRNTDEVVQVNDYDMAVFCIDGLLRISSRPGVEIDHVFIGALGIELKSHLNVKYGTVDWMSVGGAIVHSWLREDIHSQQYSVDKRPGPHLEQKFAIRDDRAIVQPHPTWNTEIRRLQKKIKNGKLSCDHPSGESKDLADGSAGVIGVLSVTEGRMKKRETGNEQKQIEDDVSVIVGRKRQGLPSRLRG